DLGDLIDEDAVLGQFRSDRVEKADLRGELVEAPAHPGLPLLHVRAAGRAMMRGERIDQATQDRRGIADEGDRGPGESFRLVGISMDANDAKLSVDPPVRVPENQPWPHPEHHAGLAP